jgi:hypothetical protein
LIFDKEAHVTAVTWAFCYLSFPKEILKVAVAGDGVLVERQKDLKAFQMRGAF